MEPSTNPRVGLELALDSLAQARRVADIERDTLLAAETARELAEVYRKQGQNQDTLKALNESLRLFSDFNAKQNLAPGWTGGAVCATWLTDTPQPGA